MAAIVAFVMQVRSARVVSISVAVVVVAISTIVCVAAIASKVVILFALAHALSPWLLTHVTVHSMSIIGITIVASVVAFSVRCHDDV